MPKSSGAPNAPETGHSWNGCFSCRSAWRGFAGLAEPLRATLLRGRYSPARKRVTPPFGPKPSVSSSNTTAPPSVASSFATREIYPGDRSGDPAGGARPGFWRRTPWRIWRARRRSPENASSGGDASARLPRTGFTSGSASSVIETGEIFLTMQKSLAFANPIGSIARRV